MENNPLIKTLKEGEKEFIELLESLKKEVMESHLFPFDKGYDGNDLKSAADFYGIAAESWAEIIRFENGHNSALNEISSLLDEAINLYKK